MIRRCCGPGKRVMSPVVTLDWLDQRAESGFDVFKQGAACVEIFSRRARFQPTLGRYPKSPLNGVEGRFFPRCPFSRGSSTVLILPSRSDNRTPFAHYPSPVPIKSLRCQFLMPTLLATRPRRTSCFSYLAERNTCDLVLGSGKSEP